MNAFTDESSEISVKPSYSFFYAETDSRGRITVPSRIRKSFSSGSIYQVKIRPASRQVTEVEDGKEAVEELLGMEDIESFRYSEGRLEVFTGER